MIYVIYPVSSFRLVNLHLRMLLNGLCILTRYLTRTSCLYCTMHLNLFFHSQFFPSELWTSLKSEQETEHWLSVLLFRHFSLFGRVLFLHDCNLSPQPNSHIGFQGLFGSLNAEDFELSCFNALQCQKLVHLSKILTYWASLAACASPSYFDTLARKS